MRTSICGLLVLAVWASGAGPKKAQREYEEGVRLEQAGRWQEAYDAFSRSLDSDPTAQAYLHRAKTQLALDLPASSFYNTNFLTPNFFRDIS